VDYHQLEKNLQFPSILVDHRTATTPIGSRLRIGGTMELSGHNDRVLPKRVQAIYEAFKKYYPKMDIPAPDTGKAWFGYRPVSPDGMPYIGIHPRAENLVFAGGHAMLGVSAAAGTGLLVKEICEGGKTSIDTSAFHPARFS
jgi:D-amino-acid dehydrogenase